MKVGLVVELGFYVDSAGVRTRADDLQWQGPREVKPPPEFERYPIEVLCQVLKLNPMEVCALEGKFGSFYRKPLPKTANQMVKEVEEKYKEINRQYEEQRRRGKHGNP